MDNSFGLTCIDEEASYLEHDSIADSYEERDIHWTKFDDQNTNAPNPNQSTDQGLTDKLIDQIQQKKQQLQDT